jgi:hypothetical protein
MPPVPPELPRSSCTRGGDRAKPPREGLAGGDTVNLGFGADESGQGRAGAAPPKRCTSAENSASRPILHGYRTRSGATRGDTCPRRLHPENPPDTVAARQLR